MNQKIGKDDYYVDIATRIYEHFDVLQSCSIYGHEFDDCDVLHDKGELVIREITKMDRRDNTVPVTGEKRKRIKHRPKNSIGGWVAHKIFKYQKVVDDGVPKWNIWRYQ